MVAKPNHTTSPRNFETGSKPHLWRYAIPIALFVLAELLNDLVLHQAMRFPYEYWQLLDKSLLEQHLWESLLLLHSQPPMFNLVLGVLLKAGALLHVRPEFLASVMFGALGLATALFLFHLAMEWTRSIALASLACFLYFANPSYYGGSNAGIGRDTFFYEFGLQSLLLLVFVSAFWWMRRSNRWAGLTFVCAIGAVVNTRSLFSPLFWGSVLVGFVLWPNFRKHRRDTVLLSCLAFVFFTFWPFKNYILFGQFVSSSLDAENLVRAYPPAPKALDDLLVRSESPPAAELLGAFPNLRSFSPEALVAVTAPRKSNGVANANNLIVLITRRETLRQAIEARQDIPLTLERISIMYLFATRPMYQQPYDLSYFDGYPKPFRSYVNIYQTIFFSPVGPKIAPNRFLNIFNIVLLPLLIIGAIVAVCCCKQDRVLLGLLTFTAMFPLISASLSDGFEGNRMRHSTYPLMILLSVVLLSRLSRLVRSP